MFGQKNGSKNNKIMKDLVVQGRIKKAGNPLPSLYDELKTRKRLADIAYQKMIEEKTVQAFPGNKFKRFNTGFSLRKGPKRVMLTRLALLPGDRIIAHGKTPDYIRQVRQQPQVFPELSGFDESPEKAQNTTAESNVSRGWWGTLENLLTKGVKYYGQREIAKTQAELEAEKRKAAEAQAKAAKQQVRLVEMLPSRETVTSNLPMILTIGAVGVGAILLLTKKKRR